MKKITPQQRIEFRNIIIKKYGYGDEFIRLENLDSRGDLKSYSQLFEMLTKLKIK